MTRDQIGRDCPPEDIWLLVAAGGADQWREHAGRCKGCASLLKDAERLSTTPTEEEAHQIGGLESSRIAVRAALVQALGKTGATKRVDWLVWAGLAATMAGFGGWVLLRQPPAEPGVVVAIADAVSRHCDFRLPGMAYAPVRRMQAAERVIAEAEQLLAQGAGGEAQNEIWRAHLDYDRGAFESGIGRLERLQGRLDDDAKALTTLGALYGALAEKTGRPALWESAMIATRRALDIEPNAAAALFNQALILEKTGRAREAELVWQRFLAVEKQEEWAGEARRRGQRGDDKEVDGSLLPSQSGPVRLH